MSGGEHEDEHEDGEFQGQMRIEYDDQLDDVVVKANKLLAVHGLQFVDDGQPHDGFCIYALVKLAGEGHE